MPTLTASRQDAVASRFHGMHNRLARRLAAQLRLFFRQQGRRVEARYLAAHGVKVTTEEVVVVYAFTQSPYTDYLANTPGQDEDQELLRILEVYLLAMILSASELAAGLVDGRALTATDMGTRIILAETINQVRGITETTRRAIQTHITAGQRQGYSVRQVAQGVLDDGYPSLASVVESSYRNRVEAIAATETARVQSLGIAETYAMNGVERVLIRDGAQCLPAGQMVLAPNCVRGLTSWFEGELIVLRTAKNDLLTCTPNHPILTDRGWVGAGKLNEGDHVIRCLDQQVIAALLDQNNQHVPAKIEQVACAAMMTSSPGCLGVIPADCCFDGDSATCQVDAVLANSFLPGEHEPLGCQHVVQRGFIGTAGDAEPLSRQRGLDSLFFGFDPAARCIMGSANAPLAFFGAPAGGRDPVGFTSPTGRPAKHLELPQETSPFIHGARDRPGRFPSQIPGVERTDGTGGLFDPLGSLAGEPVALGFGKGPEGEAALEERIFKDGEGRPDDPGRLRQALAGLVEAVCIVDIERTRFNGHVYNLTTTQGWYIAENIITHNCGWTYHFDPDKANGSVRTVAEYRAVPLSHPYCVRLAYPILGVSR